MKNKLHKMIDRIQDVMPLFVILIAVFIGYKTFKNSSTDGVQYNTNLCIKDKSAICSGTIVKNYYSRGSFMSKLKNDNIFKWRCKDKVKDILEVGDSIYKPSGTFDTYIFKQANPDSVIFIECDFDCDYWIKRYGTK